MWKMVSEDLLIRARIMAHSPPPFKNSHIC
jgi:hypothetical protein